MICDLNLFLFSLSLSLSLALQTYQLKLTKPMPGFASSSLIVDNQVEQNLVGCTALP